METPDQSQQENRLMARRSVSDESVQSLLESENLVGDAYPHFPKHVDEMLPRRVDDASASLVSQIIGEMRQNGYGRDEVDRSLTVVLPMIGPTTTRTRKNMNQNIDLESLKEKLSSAKRSMNMAIAKLAEAGTEQDDEQ